MIRRPLAILVSGRGSNMVSIIEASRDPSYPLEPVIVVSNKKDAPALQKARSLGVEAIHVKPGPTFEERVVKELKSRKVEVVALAGFMRILRGALLEEYGGRIVNIHPSLLPSFPGLEAQRQAFDYGVKVSGCTVHIVDDGVDTGPILAQRAVDISDCTSAEEVAARILEHEHALYPEALAAFARNEFRLQGRRAVKVGFGEHGETFVEFHFGAGRLPEPRYDVAVSACLLGIPCRYAGDSRADEKVLAYVRGKNVLPVCPEVLGGMWTPRTPMVVHGPTGEDMWEKGARAISEDGEDRTEMLKEGALRALRLVQAAGVREVILKERSPSCGLRKIHTPHGLVDGHGAFAELVTRAGLAAMTEEDL